jgi:hypothetical protein
LFKSALENSTDPFQETVGVRVVALLDNTTLPEFTNSNIESLEQSGTNILDSVPVSLANTSSHRIVYAANDGKSKIMQTWTLIGQKVYLITYVSDPAEYLDLLPTVQQMINSFKVNISSVSQEDRPPGVAAQESILQQLPPTKMIETRSTNTTQSVNFLLYENPALGIRIQHPVGWTKVEGDGEVEFIQQKDIVNFEVEVDNEEVTLPEYVDRRVSLLREDRQNFSPIESSRTTISGNPGHKVVYTFVKDDGPRAGEINKVMRIWTIKDAKLYTVAYISEFEKFPDYLSLAERMVKSLKIGTVR